MRGAAGGGGVRRPQRRRPAAAQEAVLQMRCSTPYHTTPTPPPLCSLTVTHTQLFKADHVVESMTWRAADPAGVMHSEKRRERARWTNKKRQTGKRIPSHTKGGWGGGRGCRAESMDGRERERILAMRTRPPGRDGSTCSRWRPRRTPDCRPCRRSTGRPSSSRGRRPRRRPRRSSRRPRTAGTRWPR